MDVPKLILGDVLSSIIGDDANSFGMYFIADLAQDAKTSILERMDWEVSVPETPGEVKQRLKQVIKFIQPLDFNDEANYLKARENWQGMKDWVDQQSRKRKDWRQALEHDMAMAETLSPYWQEFLYGRVEY